MEKINTALFILQYAFVQNAHVACRRLLNGKENPPSLMLVSLKIIEFKVGRATHFKLTAGKYALAINFKFIHSDLRFSIFLLLTMSTRVVSFPPQTPCCQKTYRCRFCHDRAEDHLLQREDVWEVVCSACGLRQPVSGECANKECGIRFGKYFCFECKLFDDEDKEQFHCDG